MSRFDNKRLFTRQEFEVLFYQPVLHPVLTYLPGLAISDEFIRIESDIKTKIIVDHHLKGLAFNTVPLIFVDGLALMGRLPDENGTHRFVPGSATPPEIQEPVFCAVPQGYNAMHFLRP